MESSEWVSILELYIHFVVSTGWLTPVNVNAWNTGRLPPALQTGSVPQAFICEADYASLDRARSDFTTFWVYSASGFNVCCAEGYPAAAT